MDRKADIQIRVTMSDEKITKTKEVEHPLEGVLDITPGTTVVEYQESAPTDLVVHTDYDNKDAEIEDQFQEVYDKAMDAFDVQSDITDQVEGKFAARNAEVAVQFLNAALNAAKEKSGMKAHKDKLDVAKTRAGTPGTVNQNLIIDRNDLLRTLLDQKDEE